MWVVVYLAIGLIAGIGVSGGQWIKGDVREPADYLASAAIGTMVTIVWPVIFGTMGWIEIRNRRGRKLRAVRAKFGLTDEDDSCAAGG